MPDLSEYIETSQAAEKLHFHVEHVRRMMREGSLLGIKIGRTWLVQKKSLDEYLAKTASMSKHDPRRTH
jgi:excisionase family DNA binding protein